MPVTKNPKKGLLGKKQEVKNVYRVGGTRMAEDEE